MALYEQALHTNQELGDVRSIAVTQNAMADLLATTGASPGSHGPL